MNIFTPPVIHPLDDIDTGTGNYKIPVDLRLGEMRPPRVKPVGRVRIDNEHPIGNRCVFAMLFQNNFQLVTDYGRITVTEGSASSGDFYSDEFGRVWSDWGGTPKFAVDLIPYLNNGKGTIIIRTNGLDDLNYGRLFQGLGSGYNNTICYKNTSDNAIDLRLSGTTKGFTAHKNIFSATAETGIPTTIALTWDDTANVTKFYCDGILDDQGNAAISANGFGTGLYIFAENTGTYEMVGTKFYFMYFKDALTDGEIQSMYHDDYQIFQPLHMPKMISLPAKDIRSIAKTTHIPDPRWEEPNLLVPNKKPIGGVVIDPDYEYLPSMWACFLKIVDDEFVDMLSNYSKTDIISSTGTQNGNHLTFTSAVAGGLEWDLRPSTAGGRTFIIRFKVDAAAQYMVLMGIRNGSTNRATNFIANGWVSGGTPNAVSGRIATFSNSPTVSAYADNIIDGEWHTAAAVYENGEFHKIFVDGELLSTTNHDADTFNESTSFDTSMTTEIGGAPGGAAELDGDIQAVYIFEDALPDEECRALTKNMFKIMVPE